MATIKDWIKNTFTKQIVTPATLLDFLIRMIGNPPKVGYTDTIYELLAQIRNYVGPEGYTDRLAYYGFASGTVSGDWSTVTFTSIEKQYSGEVYIQVDTLELTNKLTVEASLEGGGTFYPVAVIQCSTDTVIPGGEITAVGLYMVKYPAKNIKWTSFDGTLCVGKYSSNVK